MQTAEKRPVIEVTGLKKQYKLGQIGGGTLTHDLQSWWARLRGKEDPNTVIGTDARLFGQTFMALNGVDLTVYQGEALGIIGRNGAGKSTLLKILSRITAPTEGEIRLRGRVASMLEVGTGFNNEMTGRENIYMNGAILGMTKAEVDAKLDQIIEFSECGDHGHGRGACGRRYEVPAEMPRQDERRGRPGRPHRPLCQPQHEHDPPALHPVHRA